MDINLYTLVAGLLFGTYGLYVLRLSIREARPKGAAIGCVLLLYPYFVSNPWLCWAIGIGLTAAAVFSLRD